MKIVKTLILRTNSNGIAQAAAIIRNGRLVAFPTETVYGLGANALNPKAVKKIFIAKGRPSDNPMIVHIADKKYVSKLARLGTSRRETRDTRLLMDQFWPGPLTLVLRKKAIVPNEVTGGLDTVAIRMPNNKTALALIRAAGVPIAAPSANLSGRPSPTEAKHVFDDLNGRIDAIIKGGKTQVGVESTVLDLTTSPPTLLRPGKVSLEQLEKVIGPIVTHSTHTSNIEPARSPGMKYGHYAPNARLILCNDDKELKKQAAAFKGKKFGILDLQANPENIARNLFGYLRAFDKRGVEIILCGPMNKIKKKGIGLAIIDRLKRAAG